MKTNLFLIIVIVVLGFYGCNSSRYITSSVVTGNNYPSVTFDSQIKVVLFGEVPAMEEVGMIQIIVRNEYFDRIDKVVERAKTEARRMGANVIVLNKQGVVTRQSTESVSPDPGNVALSYTVPVTVETPKYVFWAGRLK